MSGPRPTPTSWFSRTFDRGTHRLRSKQAAGGGTGTEVLYLSPPPPAAEIHNEEQSRQDHFSEEGLDGSDCKERTE